MNDFLSGDTPALMDLINILGEIYKWRTGEERCAALKPTQSRPRCYKNNISDKEIGLIEWKVEQVDVLHQRTTNGGGDVFIQ